MIEFDLIEIVLSAVVSGAIALGVRWITRVEHRIDRVENEQIALMRVMASRGDVETALQRLERALARVEERLHTDVMTLHAKIDARIDGRLAQARAAPDGASR